MEGNLKITHTEAHRWCSAQESACQRRRHGTHGFDPWVRKMPWSRKWHPTPVLLPGKSHGQRNLVGCTPWGCRRVRRDLVTKQQQQIKTVGNWHKNRNTVTWNRTDARSKPITLWSTNPQQGRQEYTLEKRQHLR